MAPAAPISTSTGTIRSFVIAVAALVGIGVALGCDYPTAHLMISESIPSPIRGRMVLAAFGFQAVGGLVGTAVGFLILFENPDVGARRWMYASTRGVRFVIKTLISSDA